MGEAVGDRMSTKDNRMQRSRRGGKLKSRAQAKTKIKVNEKQQLW